MLFCTQCGKQIEKGKICNCSKNANPDNSPLKKVKGFFEKVKVLFGNYDENNTTGNATEDNAKLRLNYNYTPSPPPAGFTPSEGEELVKQYHDVATLRTRYKFMKASGKLVVTNKRLIFKAAGRAFRGETNLQYEFEMGKIGGIETRKDWRFNLANTILSIFLCFITGAITRSIIGLFYPKQSVNMLYYSAPPPDDATGAINALLVIFGIIGVIVYFTAFRTRPFWQVILGGAILGIFIRVFGANGVLVLVLGLMGFGNPGSNNVFLLLLVLIALVLCIIAIIRNAFVQNLVIIVKTEGATDAIAICRDKSKGIGNNSIQTEYTGYDDVIPGSHADLVIEELGAMISDIQTLGDLGIAKWKK